MRAAELVEASQGLRRRALRAGRHLRVLGRQGRDAAECLEQFGRFLLLGLSARAELLAKRVIASTALDAALLDLGLLAFQRRPVGRAGESLYVGDLALQLAFSCCAVADQ